MFWTLLFGEPQAGGGVAARPPLLSPGRREVSGRTAFVDEVDDEICLVSLVYEPPLFSVLSAKK
jgi:hypothetical protein